MEKKQLLGHRQRLRDKFMQDGLEKLTDSEILELLLSFGTPRKDCKLTARAMLKKYGTLRDVFEADPKGLAEVAGAGPTNIVAIKFIHAVAGKFLEQRLLGRSYIRSSAQVMEYLRHHLENLDKEVFKVIYLDSANGVIAIENLSEGSINEAYIHPREIIERGVALKAVYLIFVHNHPAGLVTPSKNDESMTRRLVHASFLVNMKVLEHLIIGPNGSYFSFRDKGLISIYEQEIQETYKLPPRPTGGLLHEEDFYAANNNKINICNNKNTL